MAEFGIRPPPPLELDSTATNQQTVWEEWVENLSMYFIAANLTDKKQQKAILLYQGGQHLRKIHETLNDTGSSFDDTKALLDSHFEEKRSITYERYKMRQRKPLDNETSAAYITELKKLAKHCKFNEYSADDAIIDQFIVHCKSSKLRRNLLKSDKKLTLSEVTKTATLQEQIETQASQMEKGEEEHTNTEEHILKLNSQKSNRSPSSMCYGCEGHGHLFKTPSCPANGKKCTYCDKPDHNRQACFKRKADEKKKKLNKLQLQETENIPHTDTTFSYDTSDSDAENLFTLGNNMWDVIVKIDEHKVPFTTRQIDCSILPRLY